MESLIANAEVHCFKRGIKLQEFFNIIDEVSAYSNMIGIPLKELPAHIAQQQKVLEELKEKIKEIKTKKENELRDYEITRTELKDFVENKPLIDKLRKAQEELNSVTKQRDSCYKELETVKTHLTFNKEEWIVIVSELDKTNMQLLRNYSPFIPLGSNELLALAKDLYYFPSKYVDIIITMRKHFSNSYNMKNKSNPNQT
jgi:DNA repair exonuclease SbcCD ATPase subunit